MRLVCTVSVGNRLLPTLALSSKRKQCKSTLALCRHPKSNAYCIILFNAQNKTGTKYELKENILKVLTRFVNDGKATIQFKQPPHDLFVQADTIQLKSFLHLLKRALENKISEKELTYSSMSVTAVPTKNHAPLKLVIRNRSEYPLKGFPRTLEVLQIVDIQRCSLDKGILRLMKLKILDLSNNCIEFLPIEINTLPNLVELNLSNNQFCKSSPKQWIWMGGMLSKSLKLLNLCHNELKFLPDGIVRLYQLITLNVDNNQLTNLPSGIGNLGRLKILTASNNLLTTLPGSVKKWKLEMLDISNNSYSPNHRITPIISLPKSLSICSLKEYAAKTVIRSQLHFSPETLPLTLIREMDLARYCICGEPCFDIYLMYPHMVALSSIAQTYTVSCDGLYYINLNTFLCSIKCLDSARFSRDRNPVVR